MANPTARKFGYPHTLVAETDYWLVLVRPKQATYGSLVLICKESATAFSALSSQAFTDLGVVVAGVERVLKAVVGYDKINYVMLMMVDPDVHMHVFPRYDGTREHDGVVFRDAGWPGAPNLGEGVELTAEQGQALANILSDVWTAA